MDHYQVRSWQAWYHHMALVMMSMLFMLDEQKEKYPLLSCPDISKLLATFLPRRDADIDEVLRQMEFRHKQRQASIDSAYWSQYANLALKPI